MDIAVGRTAEGIDRNFVFAIQLEDSQQTVTGALPAAIANCCLQIPALAAITSGEMWIKGLHQAVGGGGKHGASRVIPIDQASPIASTVRPTQGGVP